MKDFWYTVTEMLAVVEVVVVVVIIIVVIVAYVNESDPRSNVHYLSNIENKAWKKFSPEFFQALFSLLLK